MPSDQEFDRNHLWHPFTSLVPDRDAIPIERGEGVWLITQDGHRILDAISSWWVNIHGHGNKTIADAIHQQALTLEQVIFAGFTHSPAIRLGQSLLEMLPHRPTRVFFSDNGSTAVEVALKMAIQYWHLEGKSSPKIFALEGAYHGDTFGAMASGARGVFNIPFEPYCFEVEFLPPPDSPHFEAVAREKFGNGSAGILIYEPLVQGAAGMKMYSPTALQSMLSLAREFQLVSIADEVFTGFGRTGKWFASEYAEIQPDLMTVSKGITGGFLPLGITACNARIEAPFLLPGSDHTFYHGHSYTANPLSCAAANASMALLKEESCGLAIQAIHTSHLKFQSEVKGHARVQEVRVCGTILALELRTDNAGYFHPIRHQIYSHFLDRGILLRPLGNVIYVLPPYCIQQEELQLIYTTIREFLEAI